jgi:hypothetical protein
LNEEFGFVIGKPFYLISRLPMKRVVESVGASQVRLRRFKGLTYKQQQWFFDQKSKTIRSNHWKNYCMNIPSNGNANALTGVSSITSRWW